MRYIRSFLEALNQSENIFVILLVLMLGLQVACSPVEVQISVPQVKAITEVPTATPVPTETPLPRITSVAVEVKVTPNAEVVSEDPDAFYAYLEFKRTVLRQNTLSPTAYQYFLNYENAAEGFVIVAGTEGLAAHLSSGVIIEIPAALVVSRAVSINVTDGKVTKSFVFTVKPNEQPADLIFPSLSTSAGLEGIAKLNGVGDLLELKQLLVQIPDQYPFPVKGAVVDHCEDIWPDYPAEMAAGRETWFDFTLEVPYRAGSKAIFRTINVNREVELDSKMAAQSGPIYGFSVYYTPSYPGFSLVSVNVVDSSGEKYASCELVIMVNDNPKGG